MAMFGVFSPHQRRHKYIASLRSNTYQVNALKDCVAEYGLEQTMKAVLSSYYINKLELWGFSLLDTPKKLHNNITTFQENVHRVFDSKDGQRKALMREVFRLVERDIPSAFKATGLTKLK